MSVKSWIIPYLGAAIGLGFVAISFVTGINITDTHIQLLDYLLVLVLGSGAVGAASKGQKLYVAYKEKCIKT